MDKIVFDSFEPDPSCFYPPHTLPYEPDPCTIEVGFHTREKPEETQPKILFQREKSRFIFSPLIASIIPKITEFGLSDSDEKIKSTLHLAVALKALYKKAYVSYPYKETDISTRLSKLTDFLVSGNLENPDIVQRKAMTHLLNEIFGLPEKSLETLRMTLEDSFTHPDMPEGVLPRLRWLIDQIVFFQALQKKFSSVEDEALRTSLISWTLAFMDFLNTGNIERGNWDLLQKQLGELAHLLRRSSTGPLELKELFAYLFVELESPYGTSVIFKTNLEAQARLRMVLKSLKEIIEKPDSESLPALKAPESKEAPKVSSSSPSRWWLPLAEGGLAVAGGGLIAAGSQMKDQTAQVVLITVGAGFAGAGLGALGCHFIFKGRYHLMADGVCAVVGATLGAASSYLILHRLERNPPLPIDERNPTTSWGP